MTSPFQPGQTPGGAASGRGRPVGLPTPPKGWPIGSYPTYAEAQRAVDYLSGLQGAKSSDQTSTQQSQDSAAQTPGHSAQAPANGR